MLGTRIRKFGGDLEWRLGTVRGLRDQGGVRRARVAAKRLRYLLEPFRTDIDAAEPLIAQLCHLQEILGELHDSHTHRARLARELAAGGREHDRRLEAAVLAHPNGASRR